MTDVTTAESIEFEVSLDSTTTPPVLKVTGDKYIEKANGKRPISWKLEGELKRGEFVGQGDCRPGFEWLSWPPPADTIFDKANRPSNDKIDINVTHPDANSDGRWYYKLRVLLDGKVYETPMTAPDPIDVDDPCDSKRMLVSNNPIIINR